jgi:DNA gyrase/topoisomerase IV subunit A
LLNAKFTEINSRYNALIQQQQNALAGYENESQARKNKLREEFLLFKGEITEQYYHAFAEIRKQSQDALEVARNTISQQKEHIHDLKLKKQKGNLQRYFEQDIETVKAEINVLTQKIKSNDVDIADFKKQVDTLQKQFDLEQEKAISVYDRKVEKMWDDNKVYQSSIASIDAKAAEK